MSNTETHERGGEVKDNLLQSMLNTFYCDVKNSETVGKRWYSFDDIKQWYSEYKQRHPLMFK